MSSKKQQKADPFLHCSEAIEVLRQSQWTFAPSDTTIYKLKITLDSPGVFPPAKMDIPLPGLPTLDGFLSFVAFRAALKEAMQSRPDFAQTFLWQWNKALQNPDSWIDFSLPLRKTQLGQVGSVEIYDCSVGLPVIDNKVYIPAGTFFVNKDSTGPGYDFKSYPDVVDTFPLRRRVVEPLGKRLALKSKKLNTSSGRNKALDNRMYYALTKEYVFYFRGDKDGVARLLEFAQKARIGMGKKTSLGYGQIAFFSFKTPDKTKVDSTLTHPLPDREQRATLKSMPYQQLLSQRQQNQQKNQELLGCKDFRLVNALETVGAFYPPYWRKEYQTHILLYGSILLER
ncbi:MAG: hypothetical protein GY797_30680 [Deltaproteobacteria bacterium]|nr:hypothetical protein [Deltaproteobacteria bacterium]